MPFPPPADVPPGIKPLSPALVGGFLTIKPIGNPNEILLSHNNTLNLPFATTWRVLCLAKCKKTKTKTKTRLPDIENQLVVIKAGREMGQAKYRGWGLRSTS